MAILFVAGVAMGAGEASQTWVKTEMYFGLDIPGGGKVTQEQWTDFLDNVITKNFPQGFTVFEAYGQMRHENGELEKQSTRVVFVVRPADPAANAKVQDVIKAYREKFNNPQVMRLDTGAQPDFYAD
ncbi:MAG: DUF3574 domain-containing protein [Verrucomicrobiota bacterium]